MSIKRLDAEVVSKIRSSFTVNSVAQCVFELVANSLDAKSTSIAIRINLVTFKIQVADNGEGITEENMHFLGTRHATNKCRKYKDLEHLKTYGYRGEALASIVEMCQKITITSRCKESNDTYFKDLSKAFEGQVSLGKFRASIGTTVTVLGWFSTVPVRQQRIVEEIELEDVKKQLEALIIINPQASFTLRNDVTGLLILNIPKTSDIVETFRHLHPESSEAFTLLKITKSKVTVRLLIQKEFSPTKKLQYIYVNKRPVKSSKIKQHINKTASSSINRKNKQSLLYGNKKHPVYVMNIKCSQKYLDFTSKELELSCWDLVLSCIDELIKRFFGFEKKDKPLVKANRAVKLNCGLSRIFGVVEATAYKRKSEETEMSKADNSKRVCLDMFKPIEDKIANKSYATDENCPVEISRPVKENFEPTKAKSAIVGEEKFDQKSTYSKLNNDENLGKQLIMDMFLKSTQVYSSEENITESGETSGETIQEANMLFENQVKDPVKGTNTTMSVSVNVKKKRLKKKENSWKPPKRKKSILKNPSVYDDDCGHDVTSKAVQTSLGLLFGGRRELVDKFQDFSLDQNGKRCDYTVMVVNPNDKEREYMFVKKRVEMADVNDNYFFNFNKQLVTPQMSLPLMNDHHYLQGRQFQTEENNYEKYGKQFEPPPRINKPIMHFQSMQLQQNEDNYETFKKPSKPPPRSKHLINNGAEEVSCLPSRAMQFQQGKFNKNSEFPLKSKPTLETEQGGYFSSQGMQLQQEGGNYEKPEPIVNSRAQEGCHLPFHRMQYQHEEDNNGFKKPFDPPLKSNPVPNGRTEEGSYLPSHRMQLQREDNIEKCNRLSELPLRSEPMSNSRAKDGSCYTFMPLRQEENNYETYKSPPEPPIRSKPIVNNRAQAGSYLQFQHEEDNRFKKPFEPPLKSNDRRTEEGRYMPFHNMQLQRENNIEKPSELPLRSEPTFNSRAKEGSYYPFQGMPLHQEENNYYEKFKNPSEPPIRSRAEETSYLQFRHEQDNSKFKKPLQPPLRSLNNRTEEGSYLPCHRMREDNNEKCSKPFELSQRLATFFSSRAEEGSNFPYRGMPLQQEEKNYGTFEKPSEPPFRYRMIRNNRAPEANNLPCQHQEDNMEEFNKCFEPPLRSKVVSNSRTREDSHLPFHSMQYQHQEVDNNRCKRPFNPPWRSLNRTEESSYLPFQQRELNYGNVKRPFEPPQLSKPVVDRLNEDNRSTFQDMQFEQEHNNNYGKFKKPYEPPQISAPKVNRISEGHRFPFQGPIIYERKNNYKTFEKPQGNQGNDLCIPKMPQFEMQPKVVSKRRENRLNEDKYLQQLAQEEVEYEQFKNELNPPVMRSNPTLNYGDCAPSRGMNTNFEKHPQPPLISQPKAVNENYFEYQKEEINDPLKNHSETPLISKPMMNRVNNLPQKINQLEPVREIFQNPMEPPSRSRLENRVYHGNYSEQEDGIFKKPSLWSKPSAVNKTRGNNYVPFSGMHQCEQENICENLKKPSEPPSRVNRDYLPCRETHQFEQEKANYYEKFRNPAEAPRKSKPIKTDAMKEVYYLPSQNMQFEQRKNTHGHFQNPQEPPSRINRIQESNYLTFNERRRYKQQNYEEPPPINNWVSGEWLAKPPVRSANEYNCVPCRGMQFEPENNDYEKFRKSPEHPQFEPQKNDYETIKKPPKYPRFEPEKNNYEKFKKPPEHPLISEPIVWEKQDNNLFFQQQEPQIKKSSRTPLISKPISNRESSLSFRGLKKNPLQKPIRNSHISGPSPYFSNKNKGCRKSPTTSTISNFFKENFYPANNNFQPKSSRNCENFQVNREVHREIFEPQEKENIKPKNDDQIIEAPPEIVPDEALEEPPWLTPNVSNDDYYTERSPIAENFNLNCAPNIFTNEKVNLKNPGRSNANFYPKKADKMFDFKSTRSPNIFSSELQTGKDLGSFCNLQDFGLTGSKKASTNLEISIPTKNGQMEIIKKDLCDLKSNNFEIGSIESDLVIEETEKSEEKSLEKSRVIVNSQNEWLRQVNDDGKKFYFNKRTGMVTVQTPKISQTKFDFDERLDFVPKGLSPALKGHEKVEKLLSQKAKNKLHDLILEGYEDELLVIKWQKFIGNSPKTFFQNIYKEKTKQFDANIPSVHENALKIPKDFVNFNNKMFGSLRVLGQLDKKFIVVYETTKDLLILFDQHAVHERIRVERLSEEYKGIKMPYKGQSTIFLQHNDLSLLKHNVEYLESLGLGVDFMTNGLHITHIPFCMQKNEANLDLNKILNVLIKDTVEFLKFSRGSAGTMMPKILQNIINLRACRGAIKFGNFLSKTKCGALLEELSKCMLPFQCAHGRPTLSPIVSLGKIDVRTQIRKPNLKKLLRN